MNRYRLHIDIPMHFDEASAIQNAKFVIGLLEKNKQAMKQRGMNNFNVRLGNDGDRQSSNYLDKNANGHVSNKKIVIDT